MRTMGRCALVAAAGLALTPVAASPAVQAGPTGFVVKREAAVKAPPARVYEALVTKVGSWWDPKHTFSGDARNLSIEARAGGCFCERLPGGGGVEHLRVVSVEPGKLLRLSGALGPLQSSGLAGSLTWKIASAPGGGARVDLSYSVGGFMEGGFDEIAPAVDAVLGAQLRRLALFAETGRPTEGGE
jgi:uncharacterized protein YndB with AHSA1/START domain